MEFLFFVVLFLMFVFMVRFLINQSIEKERQNYRSWAKNKLSESANRRDKHLKSLIERGNIDDIKRYVDASAQGDSLIILDDEELMEFRNDINNARY